MVQSQNTKSSSSPHSSLLHLLPSSQPMFVPLQRILLIANHCRGETCRGLLLPSPPQWRTYLNGCWVAFSCGLWILPMCCTCWGQARPGSFTQYQSVIKHGFWWNWRITKNTWHVGRVLQFMKNLYISIKITRIILPFIEHINKYFAHIISKFYHLAWWALLYTSFTD